MFLIATLALIAVISLIVVSSFGSDSSNRESEMRQRRERVLHKHSAVAVAED